LLRHKNTEYTEKTEKQEKKIAVLSVLPQASVLSVFRKSEIA
jgi:hypothetical protein